MSGKQENFCSKKYLPKCLHFILIASLLELVIFFYTKEISLIRYTSGFRQSLNKNKTDWLIMENVYCQDIENMVPNHWNSHIKLNGEIYNCETHERFANNYEFLEAIVREGGKRLAVFKNFPKDISLWTDESTLFIPNVTDSYGEVCRSTDYSMSVETRDYPMEDWDIPFSIQKKMIQFSLHANVLLTRRAFWFFPLLVDKKNLRPIVGYLSQNSIVRAIQNQRMKKTESNGGTFKLWKGMSTLQYLKTLEKTEIMNETLIALDRSDYEWPPLKSEESLKSCSPVLWKETGLKKTKDPDCEEVKMDGTLKGQVAMRDDILLVIVYNHPLYHNMPYVNSLYVKLFKYIAYCGPNEIPKDYKGFFCQYRNIKGHITGGFGSTCTSTYLTMRHRHTKGLLIIADDILLNVHLLPDYSLDYIWNKGSYVRDIRKIDGEKTWMEWRKYKNVIIQALTNLYTTTDLTLRKCGEELESIHGNRFTIGGGYSDIYFIPYAEAKRFIKVNNYFLDYKIPFEISVPTVILCLSRSERIKTDLTRASKRHRQWEVIKSFHQRLFVHPVKWGLMKKTSLEYRPFQNLFCRSKAFINDISQDQKFLDYEFPPLD